MIPDIILGLAALAAITVLIVGACGAMNGWGGKL